MKRRSGPGRLLPLIGCLVTLGLVTLGLATLGLATSAAPQVAGSNQLAATAGVAQALTAAVSDPTVQVRLNGLSPAVARPGERLELSGTVRNTADSALLDVQAILRLSTEALTKRSEIRRASSDSAFRAGVRDTRTFAELGTLAAGTSATFTLRTPIEDLRLPAAGVFVVGVDVRATLADSSRATVGISRTVLPWVPGDIPAPVEVAVVLPLAASPTLLPGGALAEDGLGALVARSGALGGRLDMAARAAVDIAVDPDLVATAAVLAQDHRVRAADGTISEQPADPAAAEFLDSLRALLGPEVGGGLIANAASGGPARARLWRLPTANVDIAALAAAPDERWARQRLAAALNEPADLQETLGESLDAVVVPAGYGVGAKAARWLASAGPGGSAADGSGGPGSGGTGEFAIAVGDIGLRAAATAADPGVRATLASRQRLLAETFMAASAAPAGASGAALALVPPSTWSGAALETQVVLDTLGSARWVRLIPLAQLPKPTQAQVGNRPGRALSPRQVEGTHQLDREVQAITGVLADPDPLVSQFDAAALRSLSTAWRASPADGLAYLDAVRQQLGVGAGVTVLVPDSVTLSSRSGRFPLTVVNDLAAAAVVSLELLPDNRDRLQIEQPEPIRLAAGEKATVTVSATAAANGRVSVLVRLRTAAGEPVGPGQSMLVVATQYGTVGWVLVIGGAALLFASSGRRIVRRIRQSRGGVAPTPAPEHPVTESRASG